ncbi:hypothetical protein [Helicobacter sp. 23-1045]
MTTKMTDEKFKRSFMKAGGWFILCSLEALIKYDKIEIIDKKARAKLVKTIIDNYGKELSTLEYRIKHTRRIIRAGRYKEAVEKAKNSQSIARLYPNAKAFAEYLLAKIEKGEL